ncbi:MAG: 4-hydroxy-tetrahydrodipicolinate synthase [Paludibacteraceae bacterium]|nr:4-hydroxy-tetrahydrodipicolinate synthase [Paludibacteraceae bacterium]
MNTLSGLGTALITPFLQNQDIDFTALEGLVELQIQAGVDYLVVLGTTAESATLTENEKQQVRQIIVGKNAGRVPLVLGIGGNNTAKVVSELTNLRNPDDFAAILSVCPYYNKPSQEGLFQHFCAIADASPLPVILYNVPGRTGVNLLPQTVMRIKKTCPKKIIGIKEASGNIEQITELISLRDKEKTTQKDFDLLVISGDDGITAELMDKGANGLISVAANAFPLSFSEIVKNKQGKRHETQDKFAQIVSLLFKEGNPAGIKTVLTEKGYIHNVLRLPLVRNSSATQIEIRHALAEL